VAAGSGGLNGPGVLWFGPDGNLYVVSKNTNQVLRYDGSSGAFLGVFVDDPSLVEARHLAFGPDGNLYVSQVTPEQIRRYDGVTGASQGVFATSSNLNGALGLLFMPRGDLLVGSALTNAILRFDGATGATSRAECGALFILIGADAETAWLPKEIAREERGFVLTGADVVRAGRWAESRTPFLLETSVPGIFACGDVRLGSVKRVASSVGEGSMAIAFVHQYLALAGQG
jgi:hypothetical protein